MWPVLPGGQFQVDAIDAHVNDRMLTMVSPTAAFDHGECFGRHPQKKNIARQIKHGFRSLLLFESGSDDLGSEIMSQKQRLAGHEHPLLRNSQARPLDFSV